MMLLSLKDFVCVTIQTLLKTKEEYDLKILDCSCVSESEGLFWGGENQMSFVNQTE